MKAVFKIVVLTFLFSAAANRCFAMMGIEEVSKERAKELGLVIRSTSSGPGLMIVALELETKGAMKSFSRADLEFREGAKILVSAPLCEKRSTSGHVVLSFAADLANLRGLEGVISFRLLV